MHSSVILMSAAGALSPAEMVHYSSYASHAALVLMGIVYTLRIRWLLKYPAAQERQAPTGRGSTKPRASIVYSWANIAMPWAMESTRTKFLLYLQFVVFHLGVASAILLTFVLPFAPGLLSIGVVSMGFQAIIGAACLVGVLRMIRRIGDKYMRAISSPDDYFSLMILTVWLFFGSWAGAGAPASADPTMAEVWQLVAFFCMTIFFLVYVPFSKISHYLYYPFTRYYFGRTMGRRGVYPLVIAPKPASWSKVKLDAPLETRTN